MARLLLSDRPRSFDGMTDVKYTVFVSSTQRDLVEEREQVASAILKMDHIPCGMEQFSATSGRGWEVITRTIDICDYYVLIVAGRYGSRFPGEAKSWTEKEYEYARSRSMNVLAFVRDEHSFSAANMDTAADDVRSRARFLSRIRDECLFETWTDAKDLVHRVSVALAKQIAESRSSDDGPPGWYRGDARPKPPRLSEAAGQHSVNQSSRPRRLRSLATFLSGAAAAAGLIYLWHTQGAATWQARARIKPGGLWKAGIENAVGTGVYKIKVASSEPSGHQVKATICSADSNTNCVIRDITTDDLLTLRNPNAISVDLFNYGSNPLVEMELRGEFLQ